MRHYRLELPTAQLVTAQQLLIRVVFLEFGVSNDMKVAHQILKNVRVLKSLI
ncbi:regulator [Vibrio cholerae]|nr:regulator [Vibrio cholerae]